MTTKRTEIAAFGEFKLIDHLTRNVKHHQPQTLKGIGDDTAVLKLDEKLSLVTKDLLIEGVHFDLTYAPLKHLGYKAIAVNLSDIYAMNGTPLQVVIGIAISNRFSVEALDELYEGMLLACDHFKVDMIGGDTTSSQSGLVLSVTAIGQVEPERVAYRHGASAHDLICVSGNLGGAYAGLLVLEREKKVFQVNPNSQPDIQSYNYVLQRQLKPEPRRDIIELLKEKEIIPTSMIDVSDGLASEVLHLCKASKLGAHIYEEKIPIDMQTEAVAREFDMVPSTFALSGGEDYELLFTVRQADFEKIKDLEAISIIGHMVADAEDKAFISNSGQHIPLTAQGWDSFRE